MKKENQVYIIGTDKCNLNCSYCANSLNRKKQEFNPDAILKRLQEMKSAYDGPDVAHVVSLSGGEPLLDMDFLHRVLDIYPKEQLVFILFTNGILLTKEIDTMLQQKANIVKYVVGVDSSNEKSLASALKRPLIKDLVHEKRIVFISVVSNTGDLDHVERDMCIASSENIEINFNFNYTSPSRVEDIVETSQGLKEIVKKTGFIPRRNNMPDRVCNSITLYRDGSMMSCEMELPPEKYEPFSKFREHICSKCVCRPYCACCYINVFQRYGAGNYCLWMKAMCANIGGEYK